MCYFRQVPRSNVKKMLEDILDLILLEEDENEIVTSEMLENALEGWENVNKPDEDGDTALHLAVHLNSISVVKLLLAR